MARAFLLAIALLASCLSAQAHSTSKAFLRLSDDPEGRLTLEISLSLLDLEHALGVDADADGLVTWGELSARHSEIDSFARRGVRLSRGSPCEWGASSLLVDNLSDGAYAVLRVPIDCAGRGGPSRIEYDLFFDLDTRHRAFANIRISGETHLPIFEHSRRDVVLGEAGAEGAPVPSPRRSLFAEYFVQGVLHIWEGYDHILFLLALLLPCVIERRSGHPSRMGAVLLDVIKVVTAFTIAHSITLALASLSIIELPSRLVESVIAASVVLAALNNLAPFARDGRWGIAFCFGLLHGFGFASVLADVGLPDSSIALPLLAFNLGVEAGQLAIVAVFVPIAFLAKDTWVYRKLIFVLGSLLIALIAGIWLVERVAGIAILS